jgi:hypothetical protein
MGRPTTANQVATTPRTLRGTGWTGMLDGTSRPTNPEYELDGIRRGGRPTTANQRLADEGPLNGMLRS